MNISTETLKKKITLTNESNSKVINIIVEHANAEQAVEIANTVAEVFKEEIPKLMNVDNINILSVAKLSENPSPVKPNKMLNIAIAAVVGLMLGSGLAFILEYLDTTIKSEKDIEDLIGLPIMGVIGLIAKEKVSKPSRITHRLRGD